VEIPSLRFSLEECKAGRTEVYRQRRDKPAALTTEATRKKAVLLLLSL